MKTPCRECHERVTDGSYDISLCICDGTFVCNAGNVCLMGRLKRKEERKHLKLVKTDKQFL